MGQRAQLPGDRRSLADRRTSVVIATRDRPDSLARTLDELSGLRPVPPIIVVDNASRGDLGWLHRHPARPRVIALPRNRGGAARTVGARASGTPYVAFSDDDSWWDPDALQLAADAFDRHPRLGLVAGRTLVGPQLKLDPVSAAMDSSPLPASGDLPGRPVLGCLACASVVRRRAYLAVGGFRELFLIGGEETLLCYDLAAAGWAVRYLPEVVAHHRPAAERPATLERRARQRRNAALVCWMRRPLGVAAADSWRLARAAGRDRTARAALTGLLRALPVALADRRRLPASVECDIRTLERAYP
jgi:GT2 family glycosyltransferase